MGKAKPVAFNGEVPCLPICCAAAVYTDTDSEPHLAHLLGQLAAAGENFQKFDIAGGHAILQCVRGSKANRVPVARLRQSPLGSLLYSSAQRAAGGYQIGATGGTESLRRRKGRGADSKRQFC